MATTERYLRVRRSILPRAGKGLFTTRAIKKGCRIVEYKGRVTSWKNVDHRNGTNPYIYYVTRAHVIDARSHKKAKARYANDAKGIKKIKGIANNAIYIEEKNRVFIEAKKYIPAGSEILVDYGKEYWNALKYNRKLNKIAKSRG